MVLYSEGGEMKHDLKERARRKFQRDLAKAQRKATYRTTGQPGGNSYDRRQFFRTMKRATKPVALSAK